ncbi:DNA polymerase III subunit gamma/tau [Paenisporosarcina sp. TG20]|uniref:DNA polymerase III subunit gamma/tau n=1 Tax=Paenisporosarcina sp. TG20 TaxID=1211706 RepID=UPI0002DEB784|nr:DNA polymerase III subunit gamma/tau [Paenisporosarcina sp. TG20]
MAYQAFYRVYRPQTFAEMSGQSHVKQTLQNALLYNKTTHAYLFNGPRGTGKTSAAKIFAKALNCERSPISEPCNECDSCKSITNGSNTDVIEFDAASNSRVEEIRDIIEKVRFAPANSRFKVYIIDEVHMLSNSAFNALLKTLEEPPEHVVFILATTEPHKLPLTIISRCQRFDFKRITSTDIIDRMNVVLADSGIQSNNQALKVIAQAAAGGMRDALSMLDQVVSFSGDEMTVEDALLVTGSIPQDAFYHLAESLLTKDVGKVLTLLEELMKEGKDAVRLTENLITFFRDLLLMNTAPSLDELLELASSEEKFKQLASQFTVDKLYRYIEILAASQQEMRYSNHAKVYLETALLKMSQVKEGNAQLEIDLSTFEEKIAQLERTVVALEQQVKQGLTSNTQTPQSDDTQKRQRLKTQKGYKAPSGRIQEVLKTATKQDIQQIKTHWPTIMNKLQKSHEALLNEAEPVAASNSAFVLKFKYDIHCQMAADNQTFSSAFSQLLMSLTGKNYEILFVPEEAWNKIREEFIRNKGLKTSDSNLDTETNATNATEVTDDEVMGFMNEEQTGVEDPLVTEAEKLFGKDFIEVHDD